MRKNVIIATLIAVLGITAAAPAASPLTKIRKQVRQAVGQSNHALEVVAGFDNKVDAIDKQGGANRQSIEGVARQVNALPPQRPVRVTVAEHQFVYTAATTAHEVECPADSKVVGGDFQTLPSAGQKAPIKSGGNIVGNAYRLELDNHGGSDLGVIVRANCLFAG